MSVQGLAYISAIVIGSVHTFENRDRTKFTTNIYPNIFISKDFNLPGTCGNQHKLRLLQFVTNFEYDIMDYFHFGLECKTSIEYRLAHLKFLCKKPFSRFAEYNRLTQSFVKSVCTQIQPIIDKESMPKKIEDKTKGPISDFREPPCQRRCLEQIIGIWGQFDDLRTFREVDKFRVCLSDQTIIQKKYRKYRH